LVQHQATIITLLVVALAVLLKNMAMMLSLKIMAMLEIEYYALKLCR